MKKEFEKIQLTVVKFEEADVIRTSGETYFENELPLAPFEK